MATAEAKPGTRSATAPLVLDEEFAKPSGGLWADAIRRLVRNKAAVVGFVVIVLLILAAIFANVIAPKPYDEQILTDNNAIPAWLPTFFPSVRPTGTEGGYANVSDQYLLGADYVGRDIFSRLVYGARISLAVAFIGPLVSLLVGIILGCTAGFYGGSIDNLIMRIVDLMYAFPSLLFIILLMAFFRSSFAQTAEGSFAFTMNRIDAAFGGLLFIFIGIGLTSWMGMARLSRGQVLAARERDYVLAAQSIGMSQRAILIRHIFPNIIGPLIVAETLAIPGYISTEAFLSFIGLGVNRPTPSWGSMIADGSQAIRSYPNQAIFPALTLAIIMFAFNFLGDGLRDALDPRMRGKD